MPVILAPHLLGNSHLDGPQMLLAICPIAGMIASPKVDFNSPDGVYITLAFFGVAIEVLHISAGMAKSKTFRRV